MKFFTKKGFWNKLIIVLLVFIIFSAIVPTHAVQASYEVGGELLKPVVQLVLKIFDGIVDMIHKVIFGQETALLEYDTTKTIWEILAVVGAIVLGILAAVAVAYFAPVALGALAKVATSLGVTLGIGSTVAIGTIIKIGLGTTLVAGMYMHSAWYGDVAVLPIYQISPQEIFEGKIGILNANFFSDTNTNLSQEQIEAQENIENGNGEVKDTEVVWSNFYVVYLDGDGNEKQEEINNMKEGILEKIQDYGYNSRKFKYK